MRCTKRLVGLAIAATVAITAGQITADESALPEGVRGFSGNVRGLVVAKGERNTFSFKVARVLQVWDGNKATEPGALVGRTVTVGPRWVKGDNGKWHPLERHVAFIRGLTADQEMNLEIRNAERDHFAILELSAEQRESGDGEPSLERERDEGEPAGERGRDAGASEARVRELEKEVAGLREEMAELRKLLQQRE